MGVDLERTRGLFLRARAGDADAYHTLLEQHRDELARRARGRLPPALRKVVDSSDLAQGAMLQAIRAFDGFDYRGPGSFRRWLHTILENEIRGVRRRLLERGKRDVAREVPLSIASRASRASSRSGEGSRTRTELAASTTSPSGQVEQAEWRAHLAAHLHSLTPDHREVIRLVKLEEKSVAEVAALLGRSENATKKLLARALLCLEQGLRVFGPPDRP
jgi:RNA polymerase sigma-70 factor (subfamily 1)